MNRPLAIFVVLATLLLPGCRKNHAPDTPAVPSGPTSCAVGVSYTFSSNATDPDGDSVAIRFDWGDGDTSDWSGEVAESTQVTASHIWLQAGEYSVVSRAMDRKGSISGWSNVHVLTVVDSLK